MNGKQTKQAGRRRTEQAVAVAYSELSAYLQEGRDGIIGHDPARILLAMDALAGLLGLAERHEPGRPDVLPRLQFDGEFRRLCLRHGVRAAYVMVAKFNDDGTAALSTGGEQTVAGIVGTALAAANPPTAPPASEAVPFELPGL